MFTIILELYKYFLAKTYFLDFPKIIITLIMNNPNLNIIDMFKINMSKKSKLK